MSTFETRITCASVVFNRITDTDILHLNMMGTHLVVLNDSTVATDLLEQRSATYADRVRRPFDIPLTTSVLTGTYCQPRMPMAIGLYVSSYSPCNHTNQ
jgi:hypothetical protein